MKKNLYIANLLVAGLMTFTGCTDGFESDNANKAGYTPELQEYDLQKYVLNLGVMQQGIYFNYDWGKGTDWTFQTIQNLGHDMFAGYFHDMNNSFNDKNSVYALNDGWTGSAWTYTYGYIMTAAQKSEKINQEQKGLLGVTKILKVELMHRIADTYGPIVYTKFGQEEGDNVDSQEAAYRQFFKDLDEGVKLINEYKKANAALEPFAAADILMPAGKRTLSQWVKFANSLRLRLAIRVSMSAPDLARAEVAKAMDATAGGVLESADVKKADLLIAATSSDEVNLLCGMTAHGLNPRIHTIARIRNPEYGKQIFTMRDVYSLSLMVNPEKQAAREIERLIRYPGFLQRETFAKSRVEIVELRIQKGSKLCDVALMNLENVVKCKVLVCAVSRDGVVEIPSGHFILREGDHLFITATAEMLTQLLRNLGIITHKAKRVIICGGGRIGYYLSTWLAREGVSVQLIEQDEARCEELSGKLPPEVCIIHGDASSQFLLESEGIHDCDAVVTMTGMDEMNMIISLYAQTCGVPQVITKVGHMENNSMQDSLGLGSVICPKELCCNTIVRYVRAMQNTTGAALTLHNIAEGQAEALEFVVDANTKHIGEPLRNIRLKRNILIACISHGSKTEIPNGDSTYEAGNSMIIVAKGGMTLLQLNDIFE